MAAGRVNPLQPGPKRHHARSAASSQWRRLMIPRARLCSPIYHLNPRRQRVLLLGAPTEHALVIPPAAVPPRAVRVAAVVVGGPRERQRVGDDERVAGDDALVRRLQRFEIAKRAAGQWWHRQRVRMHAREGERQSSGVWKQA